MPLLRVNAWQLAGTLSCCSSAWTCSHSGETDEADVTEDADSKVISKGLADLDAVADAKVIDVVGLHCGTTEEELQQMHLAEIIIIELSNILNSILPPYKP